MINPCYFAIKHHLKSLACLTLFLVLSSSCTTQTKIHCLIKTSLGEIKVELYPDQAPKTVANFLKYVDQHLYDGGSFYRACTPVNEANREIKIQVIQGGFDDQSASVDSVQLETTSTTKLHHEDGMLSMARWKSPNSATNHFFICIGDQPELDFGGKRNPDGLGFAAFGKVIEGMNVVKTIQQQKENNQYLIDPVKINSISRVN